MKKKGFTLVELLAVLVVLAIISTIAFPIVSDVIDNSEEKAAEQQDKAILDAVKKWVVDNSNLLVQVDENDEMKNIDCYVTIERLKEEGYLENVNIADPVDELDLNKIVYAIEYKSNQYKYHLFGNVDDAIYNNIEECPYDQN